MYTRILFSLLFIVLHLNIFAQAPRPFSMSEAVQYAMEHSIALKTASVEIADAREQVIEQRATGLPRINATVDYSYALQLPVSVIPASFIDMNAGPDELAELQFGTKQNLATRLDLNTMIFDFTYFTGLKAAREFKNKKETDYAAQKFEVRYQVMEAYLPTLILEENLKVLDNNIRNNQKLLDETRALYEAGFVEQLDVDRLDLSLSNLKTQRQNLERQSDLAYNALKYAMGYPMDEEITATDNINELFTLPASDDLTGNYLYEDRPAYRSLQMSKYLNELNVRVNKSRYYPSFNGFINYQYIGQGDMFDQNAIWASASQAGITMNIPIFDGLQKKARVNRAKLNVDLVSNRLQEFERTIDLQVKNARQNYFSATENLEDQEKNLRLAEKIYETSKIKYQEGVGSSIELSQAEQSLFMAQQNLIQSKYDLLNAKLMLDKALGK